MWTQTIMPAGAGMAPGNIQSVVMGPGTIGTAHTKNEYVTTDSLVTGTRTGLRAVEAIVC